MFSGIVSGIGEVLDVEEKSDGLRTLVVACNDDPNSIGTRINLERSLRLGDELGGHLVSGHVDGIAELVTRDDFLDSASLTLRAPIGLSRFIAPKGSVALDGVSLTVNKLEGETFSVLVIPHTLQVTTVGALQPGARLNLEVDQLARYVARLLESLPR